MASWQTLTVCSWSLSLRGLCLAGALASLRAAVLISVSGLTVLAMMAYT